MSANNPSNIDKSRQYNRFETMFVSERRDNILDIVENLPKNHIVSILDSYDEMVHEILPDIISVKECIEMAVKNGQLQPDLYNIDNSYRELAAAAIDRVETELFDILPDPEVDEEVMENDALSKICGDMYYSLEDTLTNLFKEYKF